MSSPSIVWNLESNSFLCFCHLYHWYTISLYRPFGPEFCLSFRGLTGSQVSMSWNGLNWLSPAQCHWSKKSLYLALHSAMDFTEIDPPITATSSWFFRKFGNHLCSNSSSVLSTLRMLMCNIIAALSPSLVFSLSPSLGFSVACPVYVFVPTTHVVLRCSLLPVVLGNVSRHRTHETISFLNRFLKWRFTARATESTSSRASLCCGLMRFFLKSVKFVAWFKFCCITKLSYPIADHSLRIKAVKRASEDAPLLLRVALKQ